MMALELLDTKWPSPDTSRSSMKRTSSTHRWQTWYDRSLASRGRRSAPLKSAADVAASPRSGGSLDPVAGAKHHVVDLVDVRHDSAQRGHQLVALSRHLNREHGAQLGVAQEQVRIAKYSGTSSPAATTFPQLAFRAAVSIRLRATELRRCPARWRRPPQSPS
jgi:hypothetical protein